MNHEQTHGVGHPLIVTTAIESTWDSSHGIVWAGEWCRRPSRRHVWEPLGGAVVESLWTPERAFESAKTAHALSAIRDKLITALGQRLAEIHGLPSGQRFWRVVLGGWALLYVSQLQDRYLTATRVRALYPDCAVTAPAADHHWTPTTTYEQFLAFAADDYNLQLFGAIFETLGSSLKRSEVGAKQQATHRNRSTTPHRAAGRLIARLRAGRIFVRDVMDLPWYMALAHLLRRPLTSFFKLIARLRAGRVVVLSLTFLPWDVVVGLAFRTLGTALPVLSMSAPSAPPDDRKRRLLDDLSLGDGQFERLLAAMVVRDLPTVFLEGMPELVQMVRRAFPGRAAAYFSAIAWHFEEPFKLAAAFAAERGTQLLGTQHGGNYGVDAVCPDEDLELSIVDHYYTWGWQRRDMATPTSVMPATKFATRRSAGALRPERVLLVTTTTVTRYNSATGAWFEACIAWQERFANALGKDGRALLRVRLHKDDCGWDMASRWAGFAPDAEIERQDARRFEDSILRSRVIVCDHLSTTYAQAIVAGRPTILFWDPATELIRPEALPVFNRLRDVGVLCATPERAAQTVLEIYGDADAWWADGARHAAVAEFVKRYALVLPNARKLWAEELRRCARRRA